MNEKVSPWASVGDVKISDLILCPAVSLLVQTTVVPALTVNVSGAKAKFSMLTVLPAAEVVAAVEDAVVVAAVVFVLAVVCSF